LTASLGSRPAIPSQIFISIQSIFTTLNIITITKSSKPHQNHFFISKTNSSKHTTPQTLNYQIQQNPQNKNPQLNNPNKKIGFYTKIKVY
ncbi:hypothetical protein Leryth_017871, partial [Lithospermum erythrorhizon]